MRIRKVNFSRDRDGYRIDIDNITIFLIRTIGENESYKLVFSIHGYAEHNGKDSIDIFHEFVACEDGEEMTIEEPVKLNLYQGVESYRKEPDITRHNITILLKGLAELEYKLEENEVFADRLFNTYIRVTKELSNESGRELWRLIEELYGR